MTSIYVWMPTYTASYLFPQNYLDEGDLENTEASSLHRSFIIKKMKPPQYLPPHRRARQGSIGANRRKAIYGDITEVPHCPRGPIDSACVPGSDSMINGTAPANHTQWHSPVPYLLGGLAAMLALVALALLVLACSFWKMATYLEAPHVDSVPVESAKNDLTMSPEEDKVVVIMAGDDKPTFIAKPCSAHQAM